MTRESSKKPGTSSWQLEDLFQGEQWSRLERLLSKVRFNVLMRLGQRLGPDDTNYWRGWVACLDYLMTGSLEHDSLDLLGIKADEELSPAEDYMDREPEETNDG